MNQTNENGFIRRSSWTSWTCSLTTLNQKQLHNATFFKRHLHRMLSKTSIGQTMIYNVVTDNKIHNPDDFRWYGSMLHFFLISTEYNHFLMSRVYRICNLVRIIRSENFEMNKSKILEFFMAEMNKNVFNECVQSLFIVCIVAFTDCILYTTYIV